MKNSILLTCFLILSKLNAEVSVKNLMECDKSLCLQLVEEAQTEALWDVFLENQADLFFDGEAKWIEGMSWWSGCERVLELGSGNGSYLSRLAERFPNKSYLGIEKLSPMVAHSNARFAGKRIGFQEGDAEVLIPELRESADVVLFRLTLQHLQDPVAALQNAWHYLAAEGYILIVDSCDGARKSSHRVRSIEEAEKKVAERQQNGGRGNRKVTIDLLKAIESGASPLSALYDVAFTNLNADGEMLSEVMRLEGEKDRRLGFTQGLLILSLFQRSYQIPVDFDLAYEELKACSEDPTAWSIPGAHFMVLKKKVKA